MNSKLYVGNLSYSMTENELRRLFLQAGTVNSVWLAKDRISGRSRGFAFIEMGNPVEAQKAVEMFNGRILDEKDMRVSLANPREEFGQSNNG